MHTNPIHRPERYYPVTSAEIDQVCVELNISLPDFLKEFFIQYNGAGLLDNCFNGYPIIDNVLILSPILNHPEPDLSVKNAILVNRENDENPKPHYLLPFAIDLTVAGVYVSLGEVGFGSVYKSYWEDNDLKLLSADFVSFINNLQPYIPANKLNSKD